MALSAAAMKVLEAGLGWVVGRAGDAGVKRVIGKAAAKRELAQIAAQAIGEALMIAPELGGELETAAYANGVLGPMVLQVVSNRDASFDAKTLTTDFTGRFVEPYLRERSINDVLRKIYRLEPARLGRAFEVMATSLRSGLLRSEYWRDTAQGAAIDDILQRVIELQTSLPKPATPHDQLQAARDDAKLGSEGLRSWPQTIARLHIDRPEEETLRRRVLDHPGETTLLVGVAGAGKSALLAGLIERLESDGLTVFAIKADQLPPDVASFADISRALGMQRPIDREIAALAAVEPVALIIDQLDAVSEVMDASGHRMRLLLRLARELTQFEDGPPVHVVVSSRPFEARYDARFESLDAETFHLELPDYARVEALLTDLGIDPAIVPDALKTTLRRPFLLKLFVQLLERKVASAGLVEGELLNAWLASAPLGGESHRRAVHALLQDMAKQMTAAQTLWLPADRIEAESPDALRRAEACELIVRSQGRLGFAHQAWLDDFQARGFTTAQVMADYAWSVQDAIFNRATILRGLERLRQVDEAAYGQALDLLLGDAQTRRHLRHLVTDLIASQSAPQAREVAWVRQLVFKDPPLARRAVATIVGHWKGWRETLTPLLPQMLATEALAYQAASMVVAEAAVDTAKAETLLLRYWDGAEHDFAAFEIVSRAKLWSAPIEARLRRVFARGELETWAVSAFLTDLLKAGRAQTAVDLFGAFIEAVPYSKEHALSIYELEKVVEAAPRPFLTVAFAWFLKVVGAPGRLETVREGYPHSENLPFSWEDPYEDGTVFACLRSAMELTAQAEPTAFLDLAAEVDAIEVEEVQALVADGFAAAGATLADQALAWLLGDTRRFQLGQAHVDDDQNVGHMVSDWSTRALLSAAAPHATPALVQRVRAALEAWDGYQDWVWDQDDVETRRQRRQWAEARRAVLLDLLPPEALSPRRRRQVAELVAQEPRLSRHRGRSLASIVTSPMSPAAMEKASDADIMRMLNEACDGTDRFARRGRRRGEGGYVELGRAFGEFALAAPQRAMALVGSSFLPGRHEYAAGALLQKLAEADTGRDAAILGLIRDLVARGFASESFRYDAARALRSLAGRQKGLAEQELQLVEAWVVTDPAVIADRIAREQLRQARNEERNAKKETPRPNPVLFGRHLGGMGILPHGNYPFLDAIAVGLLAKETPDRLSFLQLLERHAGRLEEPQVWSTLIPWHGWALYNLDRDRVQSVFETLWRAVPEAFDGRSAGFFWQYRQLLPAAVRQAMVARWLASPEPAQRQLGGEYAMALALVDGENRADTLAALATGAQTPETLGLAFTAAAAWRSEDIGLRRAAHAALTPVLPIATGVIAQAVASLLPLREPLLPDAMTREILEGMAGNTALLAVASKDSFLDALQGLLLEAGFEPLVLDLCERIIGLGRSINRSLYGQKLVSISVALQRGDDAQKKRAVDLYERLLDLDVYGAHEAAKATLKR